MQLVFFDNIVLRLKSLAVFLPVLATVIASHTGLLHLSDAWKDAVELTCLCIIALNNPVVSKFENNRSENSK